MNAIVLNGFEAPTLAQDFLHLRCRIIDKSAKITRVSSLPSEELAVASLAELQTIKRGIEKLRKEVKEKPFRLCKQIDALAESATSPIEEEESRVKKMLGEFAELKRQEALEAERLRQIEIQNEIEARRKEEEKLQAAAEAQARAEAEAERLRMAAINAKNEKERQAAMFLAAKARNEAETQAKALEAAAEAAQAKTEIIEASMPVTTQKATGAVTKFNLMYRVDNIDELFASHPHVCEITEKKSAVNMLINGLQMVNPDVLPKVPGLHIWREASVTTRS